MSRRLIDCFYPILLAISIVAMVPIPTMASNPILDGAMVPVTDFPPSSSLNRPAECCPVRWGTIGLSTSVESGASACGFNVTGGTHDSGPVRDTPWQRIASLSHSDFVPAKAKSKPRASVAPAKGNQRVSMSTAIMAVTSVRVQQIVEPFAVVGPRLTPSNESLAGFLKWCNRLAQSQTVDLDTESVVLIPEAPALIERMVSMDRLLDSLAAGEPANEPFDANVNHVEVRNYVERHDGRGDGVIKEPSISIAKIDPRVGSSAIIATLSSGPFASDGPFTGNLGNRNESESGQLRLWSVFPTVTRPFCVRHSFDHLAIDSLKIDAIARSQTIDEDHDELKSIGNVDLMLAKARSSSKSSVQLAFRRLQADAIVAAASTTVTMARDIGHWAARQNESAKQLAWREACQMLDQASMTYLVTPDAMQSLGRGITQWTFACKELATEVTVATAKKVPSSTEPAVEQQAQPQLASAKADSDRQ